MTQEIKIREVINAKDVEKEETLSATSLLVREVVSWAKGTMDITEAEKIVSQYMDFLGLKEEGLSPKELTWHAKEILTHTRNMEFADYSVSTEIYDRQPGVGTFIGRVNELRFFIMLGIPRKRLEEINLWPYLLTVAYSKYSDERIENAIIRRVSKLIKENRTKEDILRKGYTETDYEKAKESLSQ